MKKRQTKQRQRKLNNELLSRLTALNLEITNSFRIMDEILGDLRKNDKMQ